MNSLDIIHFGCSIGCNGKLGIVHGTRVMISQICKIISNYNKENVSIFVVVHKVMKIGLYFGFANIALDGREREVGGQLSK